MAINYIVVFVYDLLEHEGGNVMKKIEELKQELFILEMKDRWTSEDYVKIKELRQQIKGLENDKSKRIF